MATYNNDYIKSEDPMMWELHEIRHKLSKKHKNKTVKEINQDVRTICKNWGYQFVKNSDGPGYRMVKQ